jgi:hypothetical protein
MEVKHSFFYLTTHDELTYVKAGRTSSDIARLSRRYGTYFDSRGLMMFATPVKDAIKFEADFFERFKAYRLQPNHEHFDKKHINQYIEWALHHDETLVQRCDNPFDRFRCTAKSKIDRTASLYL